MSEFTCTYEELKGHAVEFLKALPSLDLDGLDNGLKCFDLFYLGCTYDHPAENVMVIGLLEYVHRQYFKALFARRDEL